MLKCIKFIYQNFSLMIILSTISFCASAQNIRGTVVSGKDSLPLAGVSVRIQQTNAGTITDSDGKFSIKAASGNVMVVSYLGYQTRIISISSSADMVIALKETDQELDDVVVIGYGEVQKKDLTGAVSVVKGADLEGIPVARADQMLQGRIAGVDVISSGGEPGAGTSIRIRGTRSITASNDPLYVIDGVIDGSTNIGDLNPSDIESIQVLKDASATAIYGSRAANGVIIVNTKKGREGKPQFTYRVDMGYAQLPKSLDLMNASEFALFRNDWRAIGNTIGNTPTNGAPTGYLEQYDYPDPLSLGEGTNWVGEVTRTAPYYNHTFSGAGGTKTVKYFFSLNHNNTRGIIKNSGLKRTQARLNLTIDLTPRVKAGTILNYTFSHIEKNTIEIGSLASANVNGALGVPPTMRVYNEDGSINGWNPISQGTGAWIDSPVALAEMASHDQYIKPLSTSFFVEYKPRSKWLLKSTFSYQDFKQNEERLLPSTLPTRTFRNSGAYAYQRLMDGSNVLSENTVTFKDKIKLHSFDAVYGFTYQKRQNTSVSIGGNGFTNDNTAIWDLGGIPDKQNYTVASSINEAAMLSNLARFNYNYASRYYLTVTGRADGASNFAANNKWAFFPSFALKWSVANERFMKKINNYLTETSIRLSYGVTGNQGIPSYGSLPQMRSYGDGYIFNDAVPGAYYQSGFGSPDLTWEKTKSFNAGIDFGILRKRLTLVADYYSSKTEDLLLYVQMPNHTGYSTRLRNVGKTSNKGFEVTLNSVNIDRKKFKWLTSLTISHNKQIVLDIGGYDRIPTYTPHSLYTYEMYGYQKGYPVNALWGMEYAGTWKSWAEIEENKTTKKYVSKTETLTDPGRQKYIDQNGDGFFDRNDIVYLGSSDPLVFGGLGNSFTLYGVTVNVFFNYSYGGYIFNPLELVLGTGGNGQTNQYRYMLNGWHPIRNPDSDIPRARATDYVVSTAQRHDASFLRLKDVSISYPVDLSRATKNLIKKLTLTASGNNLYLWKYYNGFDPEVSSPNGTRRIDLGAYPNSRTVAFGAQLNF